MSLHAPWRMEYIRSLGPGTAGGATSGGSAKPDTCFLCDAATAPESRFEELLILYRTDLSIVLLNRYPYANGHLLVAPLEHKAEYEDLTPAQLTDLALQTQRSLTLLRKAVSAQGFNVGLNLGRVAGAGVPGHLHQHLVPRWGGDLNFMGTIAEVRIIPEALSVLWKEMRRILAEVGPTETP